MTAAQQRGGVHRRGLPVQGVAAVVLLLLIALYSVDQFLARLEQREVGAEGRRLYAVGQKLLTQNRIPGAIDAFARAHALERSNRSYAIALASSQMAGRQIEASRNTLTEILQRDSNYAPANLLMARTMVQDQRYREADSYYHRAIYGTWPENQSQERLKTRLEVADMLAAHGGSYELLSEALLLQNTSGNDPAILKHVAALLLQAGSPGRAALVYRSLLRVAPSDRDAYAGLARAEILDGNYGAAHLALVKAFTHSPNAAELRREMDLAGRLLSLDPTPRHLSSAEKLRRSDEILTLARQEILGCLGSQTASPVLAQELDDAGKLLAEKLRGAATNERAEMRLSQAERLWRARPPLCVPAASQDDPIALLLKKIGQ